MALQNSTVLCLALLLCAARGLSAELKEEIVVPAWEGLDHAHRSCLQTSFGLERASWENSEKSKRQKLYLEAKAACAQTQDVGKRSGERGALKTPAALSNEDISKVRDDSSLNRFFDNSVQAGALTAVVPGHASPAPPEMDRGYPRPSVRAEARKIFSATPPPMPEDTELRGKATLAYDYWKVLQKRQGELVDTGKRSPAAAAAMATLATVMRGGILYTRLPQLEKSAGQLGWDYGRGADKKTLAWDAAKVAGNAVLAGWTIYTFAHFALKPAGEASPAVGKLPQGLKNGTKAVKGAHVTEQAMDNAIVETAKSRGVEIGFKNNSQTRTLLIESIRKTPGSTVNALDDVVVKNMPSGYTVMADKVIGPGFAKSFAKNFNDVRVVGCQGNAAACAELEKGLIKLADIISPSKGGPFLYKGRETLLTLQLSGTVP